MSATAAPERPAAPAAAPETARPDVFVSYSRKDSEFVRRLYDALGAHGKDVWADWEDILPTADWRAKIHAGIESAKAFLFVMSPDAVASAVCAEEVDHALSLNKRIVPIVRRDVDPTDVRAEIASLNWIFFRESDEFDDSFPRLVDALETDLAWLDDHARLLVRAMEWDREARDKSFLLRGRDLDAAERWLGQQGSHREVATPLQAEYIVASRRAAARRQRITLGAVLFALALAIGLAVVAFLQRNEAIEQSKTAKSRELAVSALAELGADPELSLILARDAARTAPTAEAERALRNALSESLVRLRLRHRGAVNSVAFSSDGRTVLTASEDGTAQLWDARTGRPGKVLKRGGDVVRDAAFTPDGELAVTSAIKGGETGLLELWRVADGALVNAWEGDAFGKTARFAPDGRLVTTGVFSSAVVWRLRDETWYPEHTFAGPNQMETAAFSDDGTLVATTIDNYDSERDDPVQHLVWIWDARTGKRVGELQGTESMGYAAEFSPDGKFVVTGGLDRAARVWNARTGKPVAVLGGHADFVNAVSFTEDGRLLATGADDGTARVWDTRTWRAVLVLAGHTAPVMRVAFTPDGRRLATASKDGTARVWEVALRQFAPFRGEAATYAADITATGTRVVRAFNTASPEIWTASGERVATLEGHSRVVDSAAFSPSGEWVMTASFDEQAARLWNPVDGTEVAFLDGANNAERAAFSADGKRVVAENEDGSVEIWDVETATSIRRFPAPSGDAYTTAALSPDGTRLATGELSFAAIWDVRNGRKLARMPIGDLTNAWGFEFSRDGRLLVARTDQSVAHVWRVSDGREIAVLRGHTATPSASHFSPDGSTVLTAADDQTARLWETETGDAIAVLRSHTEDVTSAEFSNDGRFVATTSGDSGVRVWEAATGTQVAVLHDRRGAVFTARFAPDNRSLVVVGPDRPPVVLRCELCGSLDDLLRLADRRITRSLTPEEREKYLHEDVDA